MQSVQQITKDIVAREGGYANDTAAAAPSQCQPK